jgi:hypothetical protein
MVKSLIFCEGGDDIGFITKLCKYLTLNMTKIDIKKMSGKSNFFKEESYEIYKQQIEAGMYHKVLFIVDSDDIEGDAQYSGFQNTENKLKEMINKLGIEHLATINIVCDPITTNGNLEHLLLSTIEETKKNCLTTLLSCITGMEVHSSKKILLSSYEVIFKESPYNFNHHHFNKLTAELKKLNSTNGEQ